MTENPTELTEKDIEIVNDYCEYWYVGIGDKGKYVTKEKAIQIKQEILTALQEYPKLKIVNSELRDDLETFLSINQKLKAENEELKNAFRILTGQVYDLRQKRRVERQNQRISSTTFKDDTK